MVDDQFGPPTGAVVEVDEAGLAGTVRSLVSEADVIFRFSPEATESK